MSYTTAKSDGQRGFADLTPSASAETEAQADYCVQRFRRGPSKACDVAPGSFIISRHPVSLS
jgi:hypothetical protein